MINMIFEGIDLEKVDGVKGNYIVDVEIKKNRKIPDERGIICHMLKNDDEIFEKFGEVYFSYIFPGAIKSWHYHKAMVLNYCVVSGMIKMVLYDDRVNSETYGNLMEIFLGKDNYLTVKVPKEVWNGYKIVETKRTIVANCATITHNPMK